MELKKTVFVWGLILVLTTVSARSQDTVEEQEELVESSLGLSFVDNSGNTETQDLGVEFKFVRKPRPWGFELECLYQRTSDVDDDGDDSSGGGREITAERTKIWARVTRALSERWELVLGASGEADRFSGIDRRYMAEAAVRHNTIRGPAHFLTLEAGLTRVWEKYLEDKNETFVGGLLSAKYEWKFGENASFVQRLIWLPDFERSTNWRAESETSVNAVITKRLLLKAGYYVRHDNEPPTDYEKTDATTSISLLFKF